MCEHCGVSLDPRRKHVTCADGGPVQVPGDVLSGSERTPEGGGGGSAAGGGVGGVEAAADAGAEVKRADLQGSEEGPPGRRKTGREGR